MRVCVECGDDEGVRRGLCQDCLERLAPTREAELSLLDPDVGVVTDAGSPKLMTDA